MIRFRRTRQKEEAQRRGVRSIRARLGTRSIVLVGMPGSGKSAVGRRLAARLELALRRCRRGDRARGRQAHHGHLQGPWRGLFPRRRAQGDRPPAARPARRCWRPAAAPSWWPRRATTSAAPASRSGSRPSCRVLMRRVLKRNNRPLLEKDPEGVMRQLMEARYPDLRHRRHHGGKPRPAARCHRRRDHRRAGQEPAPGEPAAAAGMLRRLPATLGLEALMSARHVIADCEIGRRHAIAASAGLADPMAP